MPTELSQHWRLQPGVTFLNHGSFGPSPIVVCREREAWSAELEREPMDFFVRRLGPALDEASATVASFFGTSARNLAFVPNATWGMNCVAASVPLQPGDEVLLTDQEYGAVVRIWGQRCAQVGARTTLARLPSPPESAEQFVNAIVAAITPKTRLLIVSHVTSQTSTVFPVSAICQAAKARGVPVCIDGPHALAMRDVNLDQIGCDYYCASGHKWLSGPFGSGFLYVSPAKQGSLRPAIVSWGKRLDDAQSSWRDELHWFGTSDPAPFLALPAAIEFLREYRLEKFRTETHDLAQYARQQLIEHADAEPITPDSIDWYGSMVTMRLPRVVPSASWPARQHPLQIEMWERHRIEAPVIQWKDAVHVRVSCHLYNDTADVDRLVQAVRQFTVEQ
ncbi:MAG: aminotransferase class V-fold PLP-dependent enzyme [Planctomycetaceae bacterium]